MVQLRWNTFLTGSPLLVILIMLTSCKSNEERKDLKTWFKGNLHTHSYWSDGDEFPEMIMDWYKQNGYHFVALSDHNILANVEKWKRIPATPIHQGGFERYLEKYTNWVTYRLDSGRTEVKLKTLDEYRALFEDENFLIIPSEEISDKFESKPIHLNATNIQHLIMPQGGTSVADVMQRNIDAVLAQRSETGTPMFPHLNHPNFYFAVSIEDMIQLKGERFFEVYNGHPLVHNYGDSIHPGTEEIWDRVNIAYAKRGQPLLYGLATDDSHNYHQIGSAYSNTGRGWVMALADSLTPAALIRAMESGDFYASTGVTLTQIEFAKDRLKVEIRPEADVTYTIQFIGIRKTGTATSVLQEISGTSGHFKLTDDILFVRTKVISSKLKVNPFGEGELETAWTQPVMKQSR